MLNKVWDEITYAFPNFNGAAVEVWEWINNLIPIFYNEYNFLSMLQASTCETSMYSNTTVLVVVVVFCQSSMTFCIAIDFLPSSICISVWLNSIEHQIFILCGVGYIEISNQYSDAWSICISLTWFLIIRSLSFGRPKIIIRWYGTLLYDGLKMVYFYIIYVCIFMQFHRSFKTLFCSILLTHCEISMAHSWFKSLYNGLVMLIDRHFTIKDLLILSISNILFIIYWT